MLDEFMFQNLLQFGITTGIIVYMMYDTKDRLTRIENNCNNRLEFCLNREKKR